MIVKVTLIAIVVFSQVQLIVLSAVISASYLSHCAQPFLSLSQPSQRAAVVVGWGWFSAQLAGGITTTRGLPRVEGTLPKK